MKLKHVMALMIIGTIVAAAGLLTDTKVVTFIGQIIVAAAIPAMMFMPVKK